jgi:hypothetical protein
MHTGRMPQKLWPMNVRESPWLRVAGVA